MESTVDIGVMTTTLEAILGIFEAGAGKLNSGGAGLLSTLIAIEIVWGGLMWAFTDVTMVFRNFLRKIVFVGIFAFIVLNWSSVANSILDGFIWAGAEVGGAVQVGLMRDPSRILDLGLKSTQSLWGEVAELSLFDGENVAVVLMMGVVGLISLGLYFLIAMQVFMTLLEFYIVTAFGAVFIPWGVNSHTKWIAERYLGAIVAQGTKLMVLSAMLGVVYPILNTLKLGEDPTFTDVLALAFGTATIAFVVHRAPNIAGGLMAGSASLSAADALGSASAIGSSATAAVGGAAATAATGGAAAPVGLAAGGSAVKKAASMSSEGSMGSSAGPSSSNSGTRSGSSMTK